MYYKYITNILHSKLIYSAWYIALNLCYNDYSEQERRKAMAKCKFKSKKVEVYFLPEDYENLKILSAESGMAMAEMIRKLVAEKVLDFNKSQSKSSFGFDPDSNQYAESEEQTQNLLAVA
jgi:hypothetical protein